MQLVSMGFDLEGCKRGVFNTQNQGELKLIDTAMFYTGNSPSGEPFNHPPPSTHSHRCWAGYELGIGTHGRPRYRQSVITQALLCWVPSFYISADFASPFEPPKPQSNTCTSASPSLSEDSVAMVMSLGFTREQAIKALKATVSVIHNIFWDNQLLFYFTNNYASVRMRKRGYVCVSVCLCRLLQLLKDQWSASKSFYRSLSSLGF